MVVLRGPSEVEPRAPCKACILVVCSRLLGSFYALLESGVESPLTSEKVFPTHKVPFPMGPPPTCHLSLSSVDFLWLSSVDS